MRTHFLLAILIAAAGLGGYARLETKAQQAVTVLNPAVEHKFGEKIIFEGDLTSEVGIGETFVFFRPEHATSAMSVPASLDANQHVTAQYTFSGGEDIKAFEKISFWFAITAGDGQLFTSDVFWFDYDDNRFEWQTLSNDHFQVHWYEGDVVFGQAVADAAENGLKHVQGLVSLPVPNQVDIYIYATPNALQTALGGNARPWIAAHADPEYNLMMLTLPSGPEQAIEMERQIPHELMHIVLYRATGVGYANIPMWLNEGLSSLAELYTNPEYRESLNTAQMQNDLIPLNELCETFPVNEDEARLAYAETQYFMRYLANEYQTSLDNLILHYAENPGCERGTEAVLGSSLRQLEREWRTVEFSENRLETSFVDLIPWIIILGALVITPTGMIMLQQRRESRAFGPEELY